MKLTDSSPASTSDKKPNIASAVSQISSNFTSLKCTDNPEANFFVYLKNKNTGDYNSINRVLIHSS